MEDNTAVEIHDSTLERIESDDGALVVVISAYVHRSPGRPSIDAGTGWSQTLQLRFRQGLAKGSVDTIPLELLDGHLEVSGHRFDNIIPVPIEHPGPAKIELRGWNGARVRIVGESVEVELVGPARYLEEYPATEGAK